MRGDLTEDTDLSEALPSTINGFVRRSDGTTTVWVDGMARNGMPEAGLRALQPSDIGGSSEKIRVVLREESPRATTKQRVKPGARKTSTQKSAAKR